MLLGEFVEGQQQEVTLTAPENLKYDEFVALLKAIYPPHEEVTAETCGFLLKLADFYQVEDVIQKCDKFLKNSMVPMIEKLCLVNKYKLQETMNACINSNELKKPDFIRDLAKKPEYSELSAELKIVLLENALNSPVHKIAWRKVCKMADFSVPTPLTDIVLIVEAKRLYYLAHHSVVFHKMLLGEFIEGQQQEVTLTAPENLKYDEFVALLKAIYPPHEKVTAVTYGFLLKLADFYQVEEVVQKCDKFLKNYSKVPMIEKLCLVDKYKLTETKSVFLNSAELKKPHFVHDLTKKPEYRGISDELKVALLENGLNSAENKISLLENKLDCASNYYCVKCVHQLYKQSHGVKCPDASPAQNQENHENNYPPQPPPPYSFQPPVAPQHTEINVPYTQPTPTPVFVVPFEFNSKPAEIKCPYCDEHILTHIEHEAGTLTWLLCCFVTYCVICCNFTKVQII
uniref:LITAF domain-containing protein n=1 Tax=Acrobeloides nanus TaxID=290746 RepID=A0A914DL58_9BILA